MPAVERALQGAALLLLWLPALAHALASDRNQPITIESDKASYNEKKGISVYRGNVHLTQGTLRLRGDTMTVYTTDSHIDKAILTGHPATGLQRPDGDEADQHAEAQRVEYDAEKGLLILTGNAHVWQENGRQLRSQRIVYDINRNTVNAGGGSPTDRVHITLQPKAGAGQPAAGKSAP